ncbi:MAG: 3-deoxy-7-phosphoheptulonate synthase, partial [Clostridia bacterium]
MIIVLKPGVTDAECAPLKKWLEESGLKVNAITGAETTILGLVGDTSVVEIDQIKTNDIVDKVMKVQEPFKLSNRKFHPDDTIVDVGGIKIGGNKIV